MSAESEIQRLGWETRTETYADTGRDGTTYVLRAVCPDGTQLEKRVSLDSFVLRSMRTTEAAGDVVWNHVQQGWRELLSHAQAWAEEGAALRALAEGRWEREMQEYHRGQHGRRS